MLVIGSERFYQKNNPLQVDAIIRTGQGSGHWCLPAPTKLGCTMGQERDEWKAASRINNTHTLVTHAGNTGTKSLRRPRDNWRKYHVLVIVSSYCFCCCCFSNCMASIFHHFKKTWSQPSLTYKCLYSTFQMTKKVYIWPKQCPSFQLRVLEMVTLLYYHYIMNFTLAWCTVLKIRQGQILIVLDCTFCWCQ